VTHVIGMGERDREEETMNLREALRLDLSFNRRRHEKARRPAEVRRQVLVHGSNCICHTCARHSQSGRAAA
jgi:adenylylsulfate kinase-like enzyme